MSEGFKPSDPEPKRLKLDELFGDNPFLSPTMKARRLHEKLREDQSSGLPPEVVVKKPAGSSKPAADARPADPSIRTEESADAFSGAESPRGDSRIDFAGAADSLRAEGDEPRTPQLRRFREHILMKWLNDVPPRED